jgi:hypothetical protein
VYTVGYIRIDYCRKPLGEACEEIARYAGWAADYEATKLGVRGIFVDETPNHESEERVEYLERLTRFIKGCEGILGDKFVCPVCVVVVFEVVGGQTAGSARPHLYTGSLHPSRPHLHIYPSFPTSLSPCKFISIM